MKFMNCKSLTYVFVRLQFELIVDVLAKTSQITNGILGLSFFANNLYNNLRMAENTALKMLIAISSQVKYYTWFHDSTGSGGIRLVAHNRCRLVSCGPLVDYWF